MNIAAVTVAQPDLSLAFGELVSHAEASVETLPDDGETRWTRATSGCTRVV